MFGSIQPTDYDWQFRLLSIPVRVIPTFFLMAGLLGADYLRDLPIFFAVWMVVVLVSILVHEFGHALTAKAFGYPPTVVLYFMGGMALYRPDSGYTPSARFRHYTGGTDGRITSDGSALE